MVSQCTLGVGRERTDSDDGGKMNAGVLVSAWRIIRASVSGTRGVGGRERTLLDDEGREKKERGTPDNFMVRVRISFLE